MLITNGGYGTIWPAIYTETEPRVIPSVIKLEYEEQYDLKVPDSWSGTIWVRTGCSGNPNSSFHCAIGDWGTNNIHCHYKQPHPPVLIHKVRFNTICSN
ncbi:putative glucan endo-1,3-beta-D-glucosidase [Medicago truncatula]|nr:putative glucan endo-1,3-beta-D-glucosidase [Medicago truncatula]